MKRIPTSSDRKKPLPSTPHWVYVFHALTFQRSFSSSMASKSRAWFGSEPASRFGRPLERIGGCALYPCTSRIHEVPLHIEDEFTFATDSRLRELRLERRFRFEFEKAIALPRRRIGCIEREQCARSAARGNEKITAAKI